MTHATTAARLLPIDVLKVVAAQLIVLHHLAFYGPMADHAAALWPGLFDWLAAHARIAVQIFLVVGGFLAGQRLLPGRPLRGGLIAHGVDRYLRLALPLAAALLVAIAGAALARQWMAHDSIPAGPSVEQWLWHLLLLQDLVGVDALSAGVWYVAIVFQLHVVLLLLVAITWPLGRSSGLAPWLLVGAVALSALWFNRQSAWDIAAPYFLAAYGLGVLVAWGSADRSAGLACWAAIVVVAVALAIDWRDRLGLALALAIGLGLWQAIIRHRATVVTERRSPGWLQDTISTLARSSFALFLVHFPIALVVNAWFTRHVSAEPWPQAGGVLMAWLASVAAGECFFRWIEQPLMRLIDRRRARSATPMDA